MRNACLPLHPELLPTKLWTYEGESRAGLLVRKGQTVRVQWANELTGTLPVSVISCSDQPRRPVLVSPQNEPGRADGEASVKEDARAA